jgi:hypothetical protein
VRVRVKARTWGQCQAIKDRHKYGDLKIRARRAFAIEDHETAGGQDLRWPS